ncbi:MAG TPA: hypothetical protein VMU18_11790, partial [Rhodoblastus sp.]|nr:hypothetical protein [Rhodoblastus sp.]
HAKIYRGSSLTLDVPLKTGEAVDQGPLLERAKDAAIELSRQLFDKGFAYAMHAIEKKPKTASAPAQAAP